MDNFAPVGMPQMNPQDAMLMVRIYSKAVEFKFESEKQGRPIFKEVPYIEIRVPGDKNTIIDTKLTDSHKQRFPMHWAAFQQGQETPTEGTPLDQWAAISMSQREELKALSFKTVEHVANASDANLQRIGMGGPELRTKARAYLATAKDQGAAQQYAAENERLKRDFEELRDQFRRLAVDKLQPGSEATGEDVLQEAPRRRGRPPRVAEAA